MKYKYYLVRMLILLCLVMIPGCSTTNIKAYKGPELPNNKIAKVLISSNVFLVSLDGESYSNKSLKHFFFIDVLPGPHTIKIRPTPKQWGLVTEGMGQSFTIDFTADAGNTYETKFVLFNIKHYPVDRGEKITWQSNAWIQNSTRYNRALKYFNQGQYEKAISESDKSLENSYCPFTHILRGASYHELKKYGQYLTLTKALKSVPSFSGFTKTGGRLTLCWEITVRRYQIIVRP